MYGCCNQSYTRRTIDGALLSNRWSRVCFQCLYLRTFVRRTLNSEERAPPWSSGSVLDHRSLPPVFESRRGHIRRLFRLSLRLITFGGRSAHLVYQVHKSGRKTSIIIIIIIIISTVKIVVFFFWISCVPLAPAYVVLLTCYLATH